MSDGLKARCMYMFKVPCYFFLTFEKSIVFFSPFSRNFLNASYLKTNKKHLIILETKQVVENSD